MLEDWTDLDLAYLLTFGEHPDLSRTSTQLAAPMALAAVDPPGATR